MATDIRDPMLLAYDERQRRLKLDPHTIKQTRSIARRFQEHLDDLGTTADKLQGYNIEEYLAGLDLAASTKNSHLRKIRAFYRYAIKRGIRADDPTRDVLIERAPDSEPRIISNDELRDMKERAWTDRHWVTFHLLAYSGIRRCGAILLDWDDIDLEHSTLTVRRGKGGKLRHVPLHPALGEALVSLKHREGRILLPARGRAIGKDTWDGLLRDMTLGEYTAHDFRRTVASSLYANGVSELTIDKIMGWAPRAVRSRYYVNVAPAELQRAILRLYADDPI